MSKILTIIFLLFFGIQGTAQQMNDADAELRDVKNFHGIKVEDGFDVYLTQSGEEAVAISANDKDKKRIITEVKNGILHIKLNDKGITVSWGNRKLKAYISFKQIDRIELSGACDAYLSGTLKLEELSMKMSGASDFKCNKGASVQINKMGVDISGASDLSINGSAKILFVEASGASNLKAIDLSTDVCDIKGSGASDIHIKVNKELTANISGASDLRYTGDGEIKEIRSSGASSIKRI